MKPSSAQLGMRENTASLGQHDLRVAVHSAAVPSTRPALKAREDSLAPSVASPHQSPMQSLNHAAQAAVTGERGSCDDPLLNVQQAAHLLAVSVPTLYGWVWQRRISFVKIGRALRFDRKDLAEFIRVNKHASWQNASVKQECQSCYNMHAAGKR
jgi:excisionase family DNA binding protein